MLTAIPLAAPNHASQTPPTTPPETGLSSHECPESTHTHSKSSRADSAPAPAPDSNMCVVFPAARRPPTRRTPRRSLSPPARKACPPARTTLRHRDGASEAARSIAEAQEARQHPSTRRPRNHFQPSPKRYRPMTVQSRETPWRALQMDSYQEKVRAQRKMTQEDWGKPRAGSPKPATSPHPAPTSP